MQTNNNIAYNHEHVIGMLRHTDYCELVTLDDLMKHIKDCELFNESIRELVGDTVPCSAFRRNRTLREYGDKRCSTDLHRFEHCPECGAAINWKRIREMQAHEE